MAGNGRHDARSGRYAIRKTCRVPEERDSAMQYRESLFSWQRFPATCRAERRSARGQHRWPLRYPL